MQLLPARAGEEPLVALIGELGIGDGDLALALAQRLTPVGRAALCKARQGRRTTANLAHRARRRLKRGIISGLYGVYYNKRWLY